MKRSWIKKGIIYGITILFIIAGVASAYGNQPINIKSINFGNTLYVGGTGPNNYSKIQNAIDDTTAGDTVFVYDDSSPYIENIAINKSITLIGENKDTTIIDGNNKENVVQILVNGIEIKNFTIQKGILGINSSYGILIDNITVKENEYGIFFRYIPESDTAKIMFCIITQNDYGIHLALTNNTYIYGNRIDGNRIAGIYSTTSSQNNEIGYNNITNNQYGIWLRFQSGKNYIHHNNFLGNTKYHAWVQNCEKNNWIMNYWDNWIGLKFALLNSMPKIIWAWLGPIPLFQFDFYPWIEPIPHICP